MTPPRPERLPWEYGDGPEVGRDVPITNEPREEVTPGVPAERDGAGEQRHDSDSDARTELREVRSADPELSPETNERLTRELRDVVGAERARVPADRPHATRGEHPGQQGVGAYMGMHRFQLIRATAIVLTFAAIIALATGDWWVLPLAAGLHALGTMTVVLTILRMTTTSEHPSAELAAAMAEQGVPNPDEHFSRMVEEFRAEPERGAGEVLSPGFNERTVDAIDAPAEAGAEQSSAMTPTSQPSEPGGERGAPDVLIWSTVAALFVLSIVLPAVLGGGWLWLLPAVMVPLLAGWTVLQVALAREGQVRISGRGPLIAIALCTSIAVAVFCAVVALAFQH
jgi:hypothetical protein